MNTTEIYSMAENAMAEHRAAEKEWLHGDILDAVEKSGGVEITYESGTFIYRYDGTWTWEKQA